MSLHIPARAPVLEAAARRRTSHGFALLGTVQATLIFTLTAIAIPLPLIGSELGLGRTDLILLNAGYGLTFAGLLLFGGRLADRYGGRPMLTVGLLVFAAASLAAAFLPGYPALLTARLVQGAGAALVAPAAMAVLRTVLPAPAEYRRATATWGGLSVLGAAAGHLLSGVISDLVSWRWSFAVPLVVAAIALVLAPRLLPAAPARCGERVPALDLTGAVLATAGVTLLSYGLVLTDAHPWASARVLVPLLAGIVLLGTFALVEIRARDPLLPLSFLFHPRRALALGAVGLTAAGTGITFLLFSLHLQQVRGWSPLETSGAFLPFAVALLVSGRVAGRLIGRYGAYAVTAAGLGTAAVGLALLSVDGLDAGLPYALGLMPGLVLLPIGAAGSFAGAVVLAVEDVPHRQTGLAGGVVNTAMELGPTTVLAVLLTFGDDGTSLAVAGAGTAVLAAAFAIATLIRHRTS